MSNRIEKRVMAGAGHAGRRRVLWSALNVAAMLVALCSGLFQQHRALPVEVRNAARELHFRAWAAAALPMLLIGMAWLCRSLKWFHR